MAYTPTTITSATPGAAMVAEIGTRLGAVTGWSKVTSALVSGTMTWDVWKSAGTSNSFGTDFFVALGYITASALTIKVTCFEQWNTGTTLATNFCPNHTVTPNGTSWFNPDAAAALPSTGTTMAYTEINFNLVTTGFNMGTDVTADRFWFWAHSGANDLGFYAGLFDQFLPAASDPFPICVIQLAPTAAATGSGGTATPTTCVGIFTRAPLQVGTATSQFSGGCSGSAGCAWTQNNNAAVEGYTQKIIPVRALIQGQLTGYYRGLLKDLYMGPSQTQNGDTITFTLNSVVHTCSRISISASFAVYADQL